MRAFIILLDSFGIGATADADQYGDVGADTFRISSNGVQMDGPIVRDCALGRCRFQIYCVWD